MCKCKKAREFLNAMGVSEEETDKKSLLMTVVFGTVSFFAKIYAVVLLLLAMVVRLFNKRAAEIIVRRGMFSLLKFIYGEKLQNQD